MSNYLTSIDFQLFGYKEYNFANAINTTTHENFAGNILMLIACGILVNGPYCLITTAVSADLGNHPSLKGLETSIFTFHLHKNTIEYVIRPWRTYIFFVKCHNSILPNISVYFIIQFLIYLYNATNQDPLVITLLFRLKFSESLGFKIKILQ